MNRIFSLIWRTTKGDVAVASEYARRCGTGGFCCAWRRRLPLYILAVLLLGAVAGPPACATTRYWDSNTAAAGLGGAGTWSTGSAFWGLAADGVSGPYASWSNAALDDADLRGTGGTLALSGALTAHNLAFNSSGYILNGSTLTLGGVTPTITTSADTRINSVLTGSVGLTKGGSATLTLGGANTYTGATTLNAGVLQLIAASNRLPTATDLTIANVAGATLDLNSLNQQLASLAGGGASGGAVSLGSGTLTLSKASGSTNFAGVISGSGGLTKAGASTQILSGANSYSGATTVSAGVLNLQNGSALGSAAGGTSVTSGAALALQGGISVGAEALTLNGTGISSGGALRSVSGNNSYAGALNLGSNSRINSDAGLLSLSGGISGAARTLTVGGAGNTLISGAIATTTGGLIKNGAGTLTLSGANSYTGATTLSAGVLNIQHGSALGTTAGATSITSGAALVLQGGISVGAEALALNGTGISSGGALRSISGNNSYAGALTLGSNSRINSDAGLLSLSGGITGAARTLTVGGAGNTSLNGAIATTTGGLIKDGSGTLTLAGASTYTGATTLNGGILRLSGGSNRLSTATALSIANVTGATFDLSSLNQQLASLAGGGASGGAVSLGSGTLTLNKASGSTSFAGVISGSGGVTKAGASTQILTGANTYTGATTVSAGVLNIQHGSALGSTVGGTSVTSGAALALQGGIDVGAEALTLNGTGISSGAALRSVSGNNSYAGALTLGSNSRINADAGLLTLNGGITGATRTLTVGGAGSSLISGAIATTTGGLVKDGAGSLTLSGANSYSGTTTVNAGVLNIQHGSALGTTAGGTSVSSGAALELQGGISVGAEALTLNGTGIGSGGVLRSVSGNNSYAGALTLGSNSRINADAGLLTLSGGITGATRTLTVGGAGNTLISGAIATTTGGLVKDGAGSLTLAGTNSYSGATTVSAGVLNIQHGSALGTTAGGTSVSSGAALELQGGIGIGAEALALNGDGVGNGGALRSVSGNNSYAGALTLGSDSRISSGGGLLTLSNTISGAGMNLTVGGAGNTLIGGAVTLGSGGLSKDGSGTLSLSGASNYTGPTRIEGGLLVINAAGSLNGMQNTVVGSGATLQVDGSFTGSAGADSLGVSGDITGSGAIDLADGDDSLLLDDGADLTGLAAALDAGAGDDSLLADITGSARLGAVTGFETLDKQGSGLLGIYATSPLLFEQVLVNAGTLLVASGSSLDAQSLRVASGATLQVDGSISGVLELSGSLAGTGGVSLGAGDDVLTLQDGADVTGLGLGLDGGAGNDTLLLDSAAGLSLSGTQLSGFELLTKQGGGVASLSGSSSFNSLQVNAGTLALVAGGSLSGVQDAQIASGATLQIDGAYSGSSAADSLEISGNLTGSGTLDLGAGADSLTLHDGADLSGLTSPIDGGADSDVLLADLSTTARLGTLQGFETLTKQGLGTLGLYGAQASQVEQLQVEAGTLLVASGATLQVLATQVASGATLQVEGDYSGSAAGDRLELSGSLAGAGGVDLGDGNDSLVLHAGASLDGLAAGVVAGSGNDVVLFDNAQALAVAGAKLQGFEQLIKQNAGLASLSANATFNSVQVAGGTLRVEAGAGVAEVQRTQVSTGALLQVDGSYAGSSGADSLEVSGSLSGTGSVTLGAGDDRLILQDGADLTGLAVALDGGAGNDTLLATVDGSARLGSAIGFETLRKQGVGTLGIYGAQTSVFDRVQVDAGTLLVAAGVTVDPQTTVIGAGATLQVDGTYLGTTGDDTFDVFGVLRGSGTVDLLDGADLLTLHSAADLTGFTTALDGGAGVDTVRLDAFSGSLPGLLDWERVELLNNSVLSQDSELDLGGGVLAIAAGSSWQPGVFGLNGSVDNGGVIGAAGKRVAIGGNYRSLGDSGQLDVLVSPATLSAGGLVIAGDVQGRTLVNFASDDSLQTEAGDILVIASPNDDLATAGSFVPSTLENGLVRLNGSLEPWVFGQQADRNWYLSPLSSQRLPETAGYTGTATLGRLLAEQLAQGADERFAEARSCQSELRSGRSSQDCGRSWLQTGNQGAMLSDAGARLEGDIGSAYFGYDQLHQGPADGADLLLGAYFGYQDADFHSTTAAGRAQLDMSAPALALYGSLYWADQSYVDLSLTGAWLQSRVTTADGFSEALPGRSLGANARFGRQFAMANDWFLEPQLGASLAQQDWQEQTDASGKRIDIDAGLRSSVDASLRLGTRFAGSSGLVLQPWAKVGASYVLSGEGSDVQLEAGGKQQRLSGLEQGSALAFSAGALLQLNPQVGLFSTLSHTAELSGADYRGTEIRAGVRASW